MVKVLLVSLRLQSDCNFVAWLSWVMAWLGWVMFWLSWVNGWLTWVMAWLTWVIKNIIGSSMETTNLQTVSPILTESKTSGASLKCV